MITAVNCERAAKGLEEVSQAHVLNDIIERVAQMSTVNLCGVFLLKSTRAQCEAVGVKLVD